MPLVTALARKPKVTSGLRFHQDGRATAVGNYRNCNSTNSLVHKSFLVENSIQKSSDYLFCFHLDAMLWIKEVEMVDSLDEMKIFAISQWKGFSKLRDAGCEDRFCSYQDHSEFPVQEERQSPGAERPRRGLVSSRVTDRLPCCTTTSE